MSDQVPSTAHMLLTGSAGAPVLEEQGSDNSCVLSAGHPCQQKITDSDSRVSCSVTRSLPRLRPMVRQDAAQKSQTVAAGSAGPLQQLQQQRQRQQVCQSP
jgi:hypothetical protein